VGPHLLSGATHEAVGELELLREGRAIQNRLPKIRSCHDEDQLACSFAKLMFEGKTHAALQLLADKGKGGGSYTSTALYQPQNWNPALSLMPS
jgi:hypothetical protein